MLPNLCCSQKLSSTFSIVVSCFAVGDISSLTCEVAQTWAIFADAADTDLPGRARSSNHDRCAGYRRHRPDRRHLSRAQVRLALCRRLMLAVIATILGTMRKPLDGGPQGDNL